MSANIDPIYSSLGFNSREVELIATATPKRHYYVTSPLGRRLVTLGLGPVTLAFIGVNGKSQRTEVREMMQRYPDTWPAEWLRYHAQEEEWADYWLSFNEKERKRA
jgi:type IV secretion system protein VirB4